MAKLSAKHEAFVKLMMESDELARRGFDLLLKRSKPDEFFDALQDAGLFQASKNPAPMAAEEEGYVRIPYWAPLDYLVVVARVSGERNDVALAEKVMAIVRAVSSRRDANNQPIENYHTNRKFAEILGLVPTQVLTTQDIEMVEVWLRDRFEKGMISHALDEGLLPRLIKSVSPGDWDKAVQILSYCTAIRWQSAKELGEEARKPVSAVDDYWLKQLLNHHVEPLAVKRGRTLADLFAQRVREVFSADGHREYGHIYRPAVEDHSQNHRWHGAENRSVEGLRDTLIAWCRTNDADAAAFVRDLLNDDFVIIQRIAIFVVSECWAQLNALFERLLAPKFLDTDYLHEVFDLLSDHYAQVSPALQQRTLELVQQLPEPDWSDEPPRALKAIQQRWLSAMVGKGSSAVDQWFQDLKAELGTEPEHPNFSSYSEVRVGPGPSPYSVQDIIVFQKNGTLIDELNSFEPRASWRGPTTEGLLSTLEEAVKRAPDLFLRDLSPFLDAKTPYQHAVLWGLKQAWDNPASNDASPDWERGWPVLISFFETLVTPEEFWKPDAPQHGMVPTRRWIASTIAEFLRSGTQNDERSYSPALFPRTRALVKTLVEKFTPIEEPSNDAMTQAINSGKGKAIEALIGQVLMECRAADRAAGAHTEAWAISRPLFDSELDKCRDTNFEFSTLAGAYLAQFRYIDKEWTEQNIPRIFPPGYPRNSAAAIDGLAYTTFARDIYRDLVRHGVIDRALRSDPKGRVAREKLLERIAVAYLWKEDDLNSDRFGFLFRPDGGDDLVTVTHLFWSVRGDHLPDEQRQRIVDFWERCVRWTKEGASKPEEVLSTLATLASFLTSADGKERGLLEAVAPHVHVGYNAHEFVEDLGRLVDVSPDGVNEVLDKVIAARVPDFDYEDRLKSLLERLKEKGKREAVIKYAERLRNLPGVQGLYERWRTEA
jgi:hypothetical protein